MKLDTIEYFPRVKLSFKLFNFKETLNHKWKRKKPKQFNFKENPKLNIYLFIIICN